MLKGYRGYTISDLIPKELLTTQVLHWRSTKIVLMKNPRIVAAQYGTLNAIAEELNDPKFAMETEKKSLAIREEISQRTGVPDSHIVASYTSAELTYFMNRKFDEAEHFVNKSMTLRKHIPKFSRLQLHSPLVYLPLIHL